MGKQKEQNTADNVKATDNAKAEDNAKAKDSATAVNDVMNALLGISKSLTEKEGKETKEPCLSFPDNAGNGKEKELEQPEQTEGQGQTEKNERKKEAHRDVEIKIVDNELNIRIYEDIILKAKKTEDGGKADKDTAPETEKTGNGEKADKDTAPGTEKTGHKKKEDVDIILKAVETRLKVKVYEDIDIKDVSKESKFTIRISDMNGAYVDTDMFAYMDVVFDAGKSQEEFIASKLEKLVGPDKDIDFMSNKICDFLSMACYDKRMQRKRYRELGWDHYNDMLIFKYDTIRQPHESSPIIGECGNEVAEGLRSDTEFLDWIPYFATLMNYSDMDALILATACTGVVRQLLPYTKETNINMNIVGKRASGKSIISHFALGMFGDPTALEGSFTDTDNAMEKIRIERPILPYILDERMLKIEDKSENSKRHALLMEIFREYEGKIKERVAGQGKELSGKRTYGPIISSSVEPILDKLLEESRDLGQYRRFIELEVKAEDLFSDSAMAEKMEEAAYTYYGHGVELLVEEIMDRNYEDDGFVVALFNEINEAVTLVLKAMEKRHNLKGMFCPCSKRFALIITTLELLLGALRSVGEPILDTKKTQGWIETGLGDMKELKNKILGKEWESRLGKALADYSRNSKDYSTKAENVLGILVDNAVDKMKRLKTDINVYSNIKGFISSHMSLFYKGGKWDGKGDYIGRLVERETETAIQIRVNRGSEWILTYGPKLSDEEIIKYIKTVSQKDIGKSEVRTELGRLFGDAAYDNFQYMADSDPERRVEWRKGDSTRGAKNVTLAEIALKKELIESSGLKDSDRKGMEESEG